MINSISNIGGYISTAPNGNAFVITGIAAVLIGYEMYSKKINLVGALMGQKILIASLVIGWIYWIIGLWYFNPETETTVAERIAAIIFLMCGILGALSVLKIMASRRKQKEP